MTALYSLRSTPAPGEFIIMRFDADFLCESVYALSANLCTCPAGARTTCRHRKMLPLFLAAPHVDDGWFLEWDTRLWRGPLGDVSDPLGATLADPLVLGTERQAWNDDNVLGLARAARSSPEQGATAALRAQRVSDPASANLLRIDELGGTPIYLPSSRAGHPSPSNATAALGAAAKEIIFTCKRCEANYNVEAEQVECPVCGWSSIPAPETSLPSAPQAPEAPPVPRLASGEPFQIKRRKIT